ncbi:Gfo/Idh/MocA family oxidoreductase, partial [Paenibacillus darwinianus]
MAKVRIGIIGCGGIATGKHLPSLAKVEEAELAAFCDIVLERAEEAKTKFGSAEAVVYEDFRELLKDRTIDVVHVC